MADLPVVVLKEIFGFLSVSERLRVRCICRPWKFVIETFNSPQGLCIHPKGQPFNERWCFSSQIVASDEMLQMKNHRDDPHEMIRKLSEMEFFQNLQKIYLCHIGREATDLFLQEAHHLTRLKVLMIDAYKIKQRILSLNSLEKFSLACYSVTIELDTPNLHSFAFYKGANSAAVAAVKFRYPLKMKHLLCEKFTSSWRKLKNLETLVCKEIEFNFRLDNFESLKRIEIWPTNEELPRIQHIREERNLLKRNDLEMIISGFQEELVSCPRLESRLQLTRDYLEKIESNRSKFVGYARWETFVGLRTLVEFANKIPNELDHFLRIHCFSEPRFPTFPITFGGNFAFDLPFNLVESGISASRLIEILQRYKPRSLKLWNETGLTRQFYEQLTRLESIRHLFIEIDLQNFDCLFNLRNVDTLQLNVRRLPAGFICQLVKKLKCLGSLRIIGLDRLNSLFISITFLECPKLFYSIGGVDENRKCRDLDQLVQEIERMEQIELFQEYFVPNL